MTKRDSMATVESESAGLPSDPVGSQSKSSTGSKRQRKTNTCGFEGPVNDGYTTGKRKLDFSITGPSPGEIFSRMFHVERRFLYLTV
jgi:hypothetical protein